MKESLKQTVFVTILIHNAKQQVLVMKRASNDNYLPGYVELPSGRVNPEERLEQAVERKLTKELGLKNSHPNYFSSISRRNKQGSYLRVVFELSFDQNSKINLDHSHDDYQWIGANRLTENKMLADTKTIIQQYMGERKVLSDEEKITTITVNSDGGSRGNPGPSASGYIIYNSFKEILESGGSYIGITSNNIAEYTGVLLGLKAAKKYAGVNDTILFNSDSLMVVNQMNGLYKIKNRELWPLNQEIREYLTSFKQVRFNHVPREDNKEADAKVNEILDAHT